MLLGLVQGGKGRKEGSKQAKKIHLQISATKWGGLGLQYRLPARIFIVQTGGVVPPILYLESFCS